MNNNRKLSALLSVVGGLLVLCGTLILIFVLIDRNRSVEDNEKVLEYMNGILPARTDGFAEERSNNEMPAVEFNGSNYSMILEIPKYSRTLPVCSRWNKNRVDHCPCRFSGSAYDGSLIIGGSDGKGQLEFITSLYLDDAVCVTDMRGVRFRYKIALIERSGSASASVLEDRNYQLTLFAKDSDFNEYVIVRCVSD